jgi:hypothetical protein
MIFDTTFHEKPVLVKRRRGAGEAFGDAAAFRSLHSASSTYRVAESRRVDPLSVPLTSLPFALLV